MTRLLLNALIGLALLAAGYVIHGYVSHKDLIDFMNANAMVALMVAGAIVLALVVIVGLLFLILRWYVRKRWRIALTDDGPAIIQKIADTVTNRDGLDAPSSKDRIKSLAVSAGLFWLRREMLHATLHKVLLFFAGIAGLLTVFLLYEQNILAP